MPKKPTRTGPNGPAAPAVAAVPSRPRLTLLERTRSEIAVGFHSPEREALMTTAEGREAYATVRMELALDERLRLFEGIVEEALNQYRHEAFLYSQFAEEHPAAQVAQHKILLAPLVPRWNEMRNELQAFADGVADLEIVDALASATQELRSAANAAREGEAREAGNCSFDARLSVDRAAYRLKCLGRQQDAKRLDDLARNIERCWPGHGAFHNVTTQSFRDAVSAGERSRDLQAIARWVAPELGRACVAAGLDPTVVREVGNTLSHAGGGPPHLVRIWPEQRARIQVLGDQAGRQLPERVGQRPQRLSKPALAVPAPPVQLSWKALHRFLLEEGRGNAQVEELLPPSAAALRKAAGRGKQPWSALKTTRTLAMARSALEALRKA